MNPNSRNYTTFRTNKGAFRHKRLCFGMANALSSMQKLIGMVTEGLDFTTAFLDDILVVGRDLKDCERNLSKVLQRLGQFNLTIAPEKCAFFQDSVISLGYKLSKEGIS